MNIGQPGYSPTHIHPSHQRWFRFVNAMLRCSSVEMAARLLAYARDVRPTKTQTTAGFDDFDPQTSTRPVTEHTGNLPRSRKYDTTPLPAADATAIRQALDDATMSAFRKRQDWIAEVMDADPEPYDTRSPARRAGGGDVIEHPGTLKPLVRIYRTDHDLALALRDAVMAVLNERFPLNDDDDMEFL